MIRPARNCQQNHKVLKYMFKKKSKVKQIFAIITRPIQVLVVIFIICTRHVVDFQIN